MNTVFFGDRSSRRVLIQMVDEEELSRIDRELALLRAMAGEAEFCFAAVPVEDWNRDLSPWPAPPVYGAEGFGGGAASTLARVLGEIVEPLRGEERGFYLGGYSLAGLFALWAAFQTEAFAGVAAASPSVWFPGFRTYAAEHRSGTGAVYLSLGTKEEKTRHPVLSQVGDAVRALHGQMVQSGTACILEWNEGHHFREPEKRMAQGFAWLLDRDAGRGILPNL